MAIHNTTGEKGEDIAVAYLKEQGYTILETNYRHRRAEIDIIAKDKDILVFVEVKSRTGDTFGDPESFIDQRKEELMADAASFYMEENNYNWEMRFDFISVLFAYDDIYKVTHFKDAFFPGWQ